MSLGKRIAVFTTAAMILSAGAVVLGFQDSKPFARKKADDQPPPRVPKKKRAAEFEPFALPSSNQDSIASLLDELESPENRKSAKAIREVLNKNVDFPFAKQTPFSTVLKHLKEVSKSPDLPAGIPFDLDSSGLIDTEAKLESPIVIDSEDMPLKVGLKRILEQASLIFYIKDGTMILSADADDENPSPLKTIIKKAEAGELTTGQYHKLIDILKLRNEVIQLENQRQFAEKMRESGGTGGMMGGMGGPGGMM